MMRFGIDAQRLAGQRLGVGRYIENLLRNWTHQLAPTEECVLFLREELADGSVHLAERMRARVLRSRLPGQLWQNLILPRHAADVDALFCPSYTIPLRYKRPTVVAIHSVNEAQPGTHPWWYRLRYAELYRQSALRADRVIVPSHSTADDIREQYKLPAEKVVTIWLGADEAFRAGGSETDHLATRKKFTGSERPYLLFVGKLSQRRNIPRLLEAFAILKQRRSIPHSLLLVGPNHLGLPLEQRCSELGISEHVIQTDGKFADHRELVAIYNAADLFVHPSAYEGFCLPLVEALSCGVPTVTVNRSALGEIAGDSALTVEDPTVEALVDALDRGIHDQELRARLRESGPRRASLFRWPEAAEKTLQVIREVVR